MVTHPEKAGLLKDVGLLLAAIARLIGLITGYYRTDTLGRR
jgi:hypothetical protein